MFACTLKTNPENGESRGRTSPLASRRGPGGGTRSTTASRSLRTPKLVSADPKKVGVDWAPRNSSSSSSAPTSSSSASSSTAVGPGLALLGLGPVGLDDLLGRLGGTPGHAGEAGEEPVAAVDDAPEVAGDAHRPGHRRGDQVDLGLDLVEQLERLAARAVPLVDEGQQGQLPLPAHVEQLQGLGLDALGRVEDHDRGVGGGQHPVGVLREVAVARGVEEVDHAVAVGELQDRGGDRDAPLLLERHPVGGRGAPARAGLDRPRLLGEGPAVEQELLGEGGLPRVGVADDGERAAARRLVDGGGHRTEATGGTRGLSRPRRWGSGPAGRAGAARPGSPSPPRPRPPEGRSAARPRPGRRSPARLRSRCR